MTTLPSAQDCAKQLERSERGQMAAKLLLDLLESNTVKFLDERNFGALAALTTRFALGTGAESCEVIESLQGVVERNKWVMVDKAK